MDSFRVPLESSDRQLVERIQQYLIEQDQRVLRCQRASARRVAGLRNRTAHRTVPTDQEALQLEAMQEILEIASARVRRRLSERINHPTVHHLSRGIRNHEHRQRVQGVVQRAVPFHPREHRHRPVLCRDQEDPHQQPGENVVHEQIARLQGDQDHRHERVDDIMNEQIARLEGLQLQDTVRHHPILSTHMQAGIE